MEKARRIVYEAIECVVTSWLTKVSMTNFTSHNESSLDFILFHHYRTEMSFSFEHFH